MLNNCWKGEGGGVEISTYLLSRGSGLEKIKVEEFLKEMGKNGETNK